MRKSIERAVRSHLKERSSLTGYILVTFEDGEAAVTSWTGDNDDVAREMIEGIKSAVHDLESPADDCSDAIGFCSGRA